MSDLMEICNQAESKIEASVDEAALDLVGALGARLEAGVHHRFVAVALVPAVRGAADAPLGVQVLCGVKAGRHHV